MDTVTSLDSSRRLLSGFGAHLRRCRRMHGFTTRALGDELGLSHTVIVRIEGGTWMPSPDQEQILRQWMVHHPVLMPQS
jgi:transcriptional regulator with XRE-family HTH domain